MPSGFLWNRYSICTGLTGAQTCRRAFLASFSAFQVRRTLSGSSATGTARMLFFTAAATDLIRRLSILGLVMGSSSITLAPNLSSSLLSSIFSLKDREKSEADCFMVMSLKIPEALQPQGRIGQFAVPPCLPHSGVALFGLQQALSRNGGSRVPLLAARFYRTNSGIRSPRPSAPVSTNHRLSGALGKGKFSVNVFAVWISVIKPQTGGFVNRQFLYFCPRIPGIVLTDRIIFNLSQKNI